MGGGPEKFDGNDKRSSERSNNNSEEKQYGNPQHDHMWWGPTGRPTEREGILGSDQRGNPDDDEEPRKNLPHDLSEK